MAKRFTGTDIWSQDWFLDMPNEYKLFWNYILCECDHAGFFKVNTKTFSLLIESKISSDKAVELFNSDKVRIRVIKPNLWFVEDFIYFQYGSQLNPANRLHNSILKLLGELDLNLTSIRGLKDLNVGLKDKDKDKDKDNSKIDSNARDKKFIPPTLAEVKQYFKENLYSETAAIAAWEYYDELHWHDKDGAPVKSWKLKMRTVWFKDKDKIEPENLIPESVEAELDKLFGRRRTPQNP